MPVLRLVRISNAETVHTLEWMLQEARRGHLRDMLSSFRDEHGEEHQAFTGLYRLDSAKALMAIVRMEYMLAVKNDATFGPR